MNVKSIRKRHGLSKIGLARICECSARTVDRWENWRLPKGTDKIVLELIDSGELPQRYWR